MDIWSILGIEQTKDKDLLKKAYRAKLTGVNPEDDSEGFMKLRQAYEEAIRLADISPEPSSADNSAMGILTGAIEENYNDFRRRISPEAWCELFDRDEFVSLDTAEDAFDTLIKFLMDHFHLPQKVWKYIVETFDIAERKKELCETYPEDFIGYALNNATYEDLINYYLFDGDEEQFDRFIEKYYRLDAAIRKRDMDQQNALISEIEELDVYHPYFDVCKIRHEIQVLNSKAEQTDISDEGTDEDTPSVAKLFCRELLELQNRINELCEEIPDDIFIINACGDVAMIREQYEEAKVYYDRTAAMDPDNYMVKGKQAELLYCLGEYEKSRDTYMDLLKINHFDNNVRAGMIRANQGFIGQLKEKLAENPDDNKSRMEMAWCHYQSYQFSEAIAVLNEFTPDEEKICEYFNVKGRTYLCLSDYENALKCFQIWKAAIEALPQDDESEETQKKRKRYEYVNFLIGDCYLKTKQYDKARQFFDIAMKKEHEEIILSFEAKCELEYNTNNFEACLDACEALLSRDDRSFIGYNYMAKSYFRLGYLKETLNSCEHAIGIYPYVSEPYCQEISVFLKVNQIDAARSVLERYKSFGIESDNLDYHEARILMVEDKQQEAVKLLNKTISRSNPKDTDMEEYSELYMLLGFCFEDLEETDLAYKQYEKVTELVPEHIAAYGKMAGILRKTGKYNEAVKMYSKQLEYNPQPVYYINRGLLQNFLLNYKSALNDFEQALKMEPDNAYCYLKMGLIYELHREFVKALECYDNAIKYTNSEDERLRDLFALKARTLQCMNNFDESLKVYKAYVERFGLNADIAYDYSELLLRMNRIDETVELLHKCIDTLEYNDEVQALIRQLCSIYGLEGYIDRANECFELAIGKQKNDVRAYATMGEVFLDHGLYDQAREMYEKAVSLDTDKKQNYYSNLIEAMLSKRILFKPDVRSLAAKAVIAEKDRRIPIDYIKMARLYRVLKKPKDAMSVIEKGMRCKRCSGCFYSKCHELWYERALLYESIRDYEMARMCYREAIKVCGHNTLYEEKLKRIENK